MKLTAILSIPLSLLAAVSLPWAQSGAAQETPTQPSPAPSASPQRVFCATASPERVITRANSQFTVSVDSSAPNEPVSFEVVRLRPSPEAVVRRGNGIGTLYYFAVPENTDLAVRTVDAAGAQRAECPVERVTVEVQPGVSIGATRISARQYVFTGRVVPGRGQLVTLYRTATDGSGAAVVTAQGRVLSDGTWRIARSFTGSGRFGFHAAVPASATNLAGRSATRPTVIH